LKDSLSLRRFLGIALDEYTPDHSTISRTRRLIDVVTHQEAFAWVLGLLADRGWLQGKRIRMRWPDHEHRRVDAIAQNLPNMAWERVSAGAGSIEEQPKHAY
jgi:hypothetical protein